MESSKSIEFALSNVIILDNIFHHFPSPGTLRLVCKQWNDVILSGKSTPMALNLFCLLDKENTEEFEDLLKSLGSRLLKRTSISLPDDIVGDEDENIFDQVPIKVVLVCKKLGPNIREMVISWWPEIIPALRRILGLCLNLTSLKFKVKTFDSNKFQFTRRLPLSSANEDLQQIQQMPQLRDVKLIYTWPKPQDDNEHIKLIESVAKLFEDLLNASPKLQKLHVKSFICPNWDSNTEIKEFRLQYQYKYFDCMGDPFLNMVNFNLHTTWSILEKMKGSLELFQLIDTRGMSSCFKLPVMPKLKTFLYNDFPTHLWPHKYPDLRQFWMDRMPSLVHLALPLYGGQCDDNGSDALDKLLLLRNNKIKRLQLTGVPLKSDHLFIEKCTKLRTPFPDLEGLKLSFCRGIDGADLDRDDCGEWVGKTLRYCSKLGLRHLRIDTDFCLGMRKMVNALWECRRDLFSGLNTLEVINYDCADNAVSDDLSSELEIQLQEILIMTKGMASVVFEGFLMRSNLAKRLEEFISDHNLPVSFGNGEFRQILL